MFVDIVSLLVLLPYQEISAVVLSTEYCSARGFTSVIVITPSGIVVIVSAILLPEEYTL
jgi:hypothetical protein